MMYLDCVEVQKKQRKTLKRIKFKQLNNLVSYRSCIFGKDVKELPLTHIFDVLILMGSLQFLM